MSDDTHAEQSSTAEVTEQKDVQAPLQESKKTEGDKLIHTLRGIGKRATELGLDAAEILGLKTHIETNQDDEDEKPVTVGMLRDLQKKDAQKTALQMADDISDEATRTTVKQSLTDRIVPSGNADEDFKFALSAASAEKNKEIRNHIATFVPPKKTAAGGSSPAHVEEEFTPTPEEQRFMQKPYNLSKEKVLEARRKNAEKNS